MKKIVAIIGICIFCIYLILFNRLSLEKKRIDKEINDKIGKLNTYIESTRGLPLVDVTSILTDRKAELEGIYKDYIVHLGFRSEVPDIERPGLYFKDQLHKVRKELEAESEKEGVTIPSSLGFDEKVPKDEDVPGLVARLEIAKVLVNKAIANKVNEFTSIEFQPINNSGSFLFTEIPIKLRLTSKTEPLIKFLDGIQEYGRFFAIKSLKIESIADSKVSLEILVSGIIFI